MVKASAKKRLLFVCPSLEAGGAEKLVVDLLRNLDRSRFSLHLVVFSRRGRFTDDLPGDVIVHDLRKKNRFDFFKLIFRLAFSVLPIVRPDVVVSFLWYGNVISLLARLLSSCKPRLLASEHTAPGLAPSQRRLGAKLLSRLLYPAADRIVAVSEGIRSELSTHHGIDRRRISVIPNGVDLAEIRMRAGEKITDGRFALFRGPKIVSCGRLSPEKNYPLLIRAFGNLSAECGARLFIIGEGGEERALRGLIEKNGLESRVVLLGYQKNPFSYMAAADVFVLSSLFEGFGNVIVEAMACGTAVVATDCPYGPGEIIEHRMSGLLVASNDEAELSRTIREVLSDATLRARLARGGKIRAESFDIRRLAGNYEKIIAEID